MSKKEIKGDNGEIYTLKQPWFKQFWVWIPIIILLIGGSYWIGGFSKNSKVSHSNTTSTKTYSASIQEHSSSKTNSSLKKSHTSLPVNW